LELRKGRSKKKRACELIYSRQRDDWREVATRDRTAEREDQTKEGRELMHARSKRRSKTARVRDGDEGERGERE